MADALLVSSGSQSFLGVVYGCARSLYFSSYGSIGIPLPSSIDPAHPFRFSYPWGRRYLLLGPHPDPYPYPCPTVTYSSFYPDIYLYPITYLHHYPYPQRLPSTFPLTSASLLPDLTYACIHYPYPYRYPNHYDTITLSLTITCLTLTITLDRHILIVPLNPPLPLNSPLPLPSFLPLP